VHEKVDRAAVQPAIAGRGTNVEVYLPASEEEGVVK
jgi:hypothetical protein